jgi:hypothetical protein
MVANRMRPGGPRYQNHALQDYQMQLMLLEQQNKKRLMMARQEQTDGTHQADGIISNDISSADSNSIIQAQHEAAQDEQLPKATSTVSGAYIAGSQSLSVTWFKLIEWRQ